MFVSSVLITFLFRNNERLTQLEEIRVSGGEFIDWENNDELACGTLNQL
jgi:hypothetical protein